MNDEVLEELRAQLLARGSALANTESVDGGLEFHVRSILAETLAAVEGSIEHLPVSVEYHDLPDLSTHGERSAAMDVDPAEPLMAAEVLFAVALPLLVARVTADGYSGRELAVARALHHAIWRRFPPGAIAYVEVLRGRLQQSQYETRQRISRELHDRIAHGIAAGLQRLEVANKTSRDASVTAAMRIFRHALADTQDLALDLRSLVGDRALLEAIDEYAYATGGGGVLPVHAVETGVTRPLPAVASEELFTIIMEATRNARTHAVNATAVAVRLAWSPTKVEITVTDDGDGYDDGKLQVTSLGLRGIAERAALIGATVEFLNGTGATGLKLTLPFVAPRHA
ncbi:sensor histidine kinase [Agromyces bauzanensis]|uniref:histidine kinase n=1 Tax=Agromyces bauzanensis TaxID=1308924 RepID=A0A917PVK5_9MICO|nr:histidine kinase [Agromyces bauzanensis]GGJ94838.1 two-component sensor histidine kinase [Agromyces bauzanensis]